MQCLGGDGGIVIHVKHLINCTSERRNTHFQRREQVSNIWYYNHGYILTKYLFMLSACPRCMRIHIYSCWVPALHEDTYSFMLSACPRCMRIQQCKRTDSLLIFVCTLNKSIGHVIVITRSRDDYGKYNLECA